MKKFYFLAVSLLCLFFLASCSDDESSANLKDDIYGEWLVTRTLVTPSNDFPNGYQDQQNWTFTKTGDVPTLTTSAGSVQGVWKSSSTWASPHWVFEAEGTDPLTSMNIKVVVEIIGISPMKGTNETYYRDPYTGLWKILDGFSIVGQRK